MEFIEKLKEQFSFFKGNYLILILSWILMDFAGELPGTYYSDYVIQLGGSATIIGLITLVSMLSLASVQFPGGYLADKYGRRWLVSTLTFGVALSYVFYAAAPSWHFILIGAAIQNFCLLYQPALIAMMADSLPPEKRGMGFSILNLIISVSTTPAPIVALLLVSTFGSETGMRIAYTIVVFFFLAAATIRLKLRESMKSADKLGPKEALLSYPKALKEGINVWKVVPRSTLFLFFSTIIVRSSFAMTGGLLLVYAFYELQIGGTPQPSVYAPENDPALQLARIQWGYVMIALFIAMIILSFPVGKLLDKAGRKIPLIMSSISLIPAILLFIYGNYLILFIAMPLIGFAQLLGFSSYQTLFADLVPQAQRGKVTGSMNFFTYIFMAIGGIVGGLLYDNVSPQFPFLLMSLLIVPSILLATFYVHEPKPEEREA
ncbi:MAG: MFS transporter [Candidatus Bathyarchaeota archaeon]|nr:MFS transporter [Candidatus Bathyarchaeota archaeon]MDH5495280.1 MFS transporter [Candidatus Bathyarchaeota archaeon]